ncbi:Transferase [Macleaya cordata]|uniref:Transferase n=1 Tax=Macleaya cordata TaxID=56857 RepID=A0A200RCR4_MACCD|nr:Transferase [Macleaya cordata]
MVMKVQIISRDTIKPSCPTPLHLRSFKLSLLDQLAPPIYVPIILFYAIDHNDKRRTIEDIEKCRSRLKKSLSETLTRFYPLAGRIKQDVSIDCNDDGVVYLDAFVNCKLSEVVNKQPDVDVLKLLFPCEPYSNWTGSQSSSGSEVVLLVQVNVFDCGGIAIALCISHKIADASSLTTFVNAWASTARGSGQTVGSRFEFVSLFSPMDLGFNTTTWIAKERVVTKRFVFDASKIAALRTNYACNASCVENPTRFEVVSAFMLRRLIEVTRARKEPVLGSYVASIAVNLRGRTVPPLPHQSFGNNCITSLTKFWTNECEKKNWINLVSGLRDAIRKIDNDFIRKLEYEYLNFVKENTEKLSDDQVEVVKLCFTSWCKFPYYEVNFGWGKPEWVSTITVPFKNVVVFMDTKSGDGIEAWLNMLEEDMAEFERDSEILDFDSTQIDRK